MIVNILAAFGAIVLAFGLLAILMNWAYPGN